MRRYYFVFLVIAITFVSSTEAASNAHRSKMVTILDQPDASQSPTDGHGLIGNKRSLRSVKGDGELATSSTADTSEERANFASVLKPFASAAKKMKAGIKRGVEKMTINDVLKKAFAEGIPPNIIKEYLGLTGYIVNVEKHPNWKYYARYLEKWMQQKR